MSDSCQNWYLRNKQTRRVYETVLSDFHKENDVVCK